jgi:hypothetical protein
MIDILLDKNAAFLFTAYGVFLGALIVYLISLRARNSSLDKEEIMLKEIEAERRKR